MLNSSNCLGKIVKWSKKSAKFEERQRKKLLILSKNRENKELIQSIGREKISRISPNDFIKNNEFLKTGVPEKSRISTIGRGIKLRISSNYLGKNHEIQQMVSKKMQNSLNGLDETFKIRQTASIKMSNSFSGLRKNSSNDRKKLRNLKSNCIKNR